MRTGASVARIVWDLEKRRVKREARRGSRIAWGEGEVKHDVRCQTGRVTTMLVPGAVKRRAGEVCGGYLRGHVVDHRC